MYDWNLSQSLHFCLDFIMMSQKKKISCLVFLGWFDRKYPKKKKNCTEFAPLTNLQIDVV